MSANRVPPRDASKCVGSFVRQAAPGLGFAAKGGLISPPGTKFKQQHISLIGLPTADPGRLWLNWSKEKVLTPIVLEGSKTKLDDRHFAKNRPPGNCGILKFGTF